MNVFQLFKLLAVCAVLCAGFVRSQENCPGIGNEQLQPDSPINRMADNKILMRARGSRTTEDFIGNMEKDKCDQPEEPSDQVAEEKTSFSKSKRAIQELVLPRITTCEPCPPRVHNLRRFYGNCYVLIPWRQNVRYVTCNRKCSQACTCSKSYCRQTHYNKVWFLSYCFSNNLPGGYHFGLNFRFLWLPQDCMCQEYHFKG